MFTPQFPFQNAMPSLLRLAVQFQRQFNSSPALAGSRNSSGDINSNSSAALVYDRPGDPEQALHLKRLEVDPCDEDQIAVKFLMVLRQCTRTSFVLLSSL